MKYKIFHLFILFGIFGSAQNQFELKEISKNYHVKINAPNCNGVECFGKSTITLTHKTTAEKLQILTSENFAFETETDSANAKNIQFDQTESPLILDDFNFDSFEDVAVINRSSADSKSFLYDIFVYDSIQKQFLINDGLTNLVKDNSAMFTLDSNRKRLIIHLKSGCCVHTTKEYNVFQERDPLKVYEFQEDTRDAKTVITIKSEYIDYKWFAKTTTYPREIYYKNNDENTKRD